MHQTTSNVQDPRGAHRLPLPCALALLLAAAACTPSSKVDPGKVKVSDEMQLQADKEFVREPVQDQASQAVLRQRTIFEHEFEAGSAKLNALGQRDVGILAAAMRETGGSIAVRQGSASAELYAARRDAVRKAVQARGIAADRIRLDDTSPDAGGTSTDNALHIRERIQRSPMKPPPKDILSPTGGSNAGGM